MFLTQVLKIQIVVFRRRMNMAVRPIHRIKHVVDFSGQLTAATALFVNLVSTVDAPVIANTSECETGSKVNGIFLNVEVASNEAFDTGAIPQVYMAVLKNPMGDITTFNVTTAGDDDRKRYLIHQEMVMINNTIGGNPRTLFKGVIVIPKGFRRNGPSDKLQVVIQSTALNIVVCVQCIYKEFR